MLQKTTKQSRNNSAPLFVQEDVRHDRMAEHKDGRDLFSNIITDYVVLKETHRFYDKGYTDKKCNAQRALFRYMRDPRGKPMPDSLWKRLQARCGISKDDEQLLEPRRADDYEMAIHWDVVGRNIQWRPLREAREKEEMLVYVQAVDTVKKEKLPDADWEKLMKTKSMTARGNCLAMCPLYKGMRVRLLAKLSAAHLLMNDAVGTVVDFAFRQGERDWDTDDLDKGFVLL